MNITDSDIDRALAAHNSTDSSRGYVPLDQRLREAFPGVSTEAIQQLEARCDEIYGVAARLSTKVRDEGLDRRSALQTFATQFPFLTAERLRQTWDREVL